MDVAHSVVSLVQLVRIPDCDSGGHGFESHTAPHSCLVAQLVEQMTVNHPVAGSIPA